MLATRRKRFSSIGFVFLIVLSLYELLCFLASRSGMTDALSETWKTLLSFAFFYLISLPVGLLLLRSLPEKEPPIRKSVGRKTGVCLFLFTYCLFNTGIWLYNLLFTGSVFLAPPDFAGFSDRDRIAFVADAAVFVCLAPLCEEYVFRKLLTERLSELGTCSTILYSAFVFSLIHGRVSQLFGTAALGLALGAVYYYSGNLRFCVLAHAGINLLNGLILPLLSSFFQPLQTVVVNLCVPVSILILFRIRKKASFFAHFHAVAEGKRFCAALLNPGTLLFALAAIGLMITD